MKQVAHQWAFAGIPVGIVVGYARIGVLPDWLFYPGEALVVAGLAVTEDGPYRYVRHRDTSSDRGLHRARVSSAVVGCAARDPHRCWQSDRVPDSHRRGVPVQRARRRLRQLHEKDQAPDPVRLVDATAVVASRSVDWRYRMRASVQPRPSSDRAAGHSGCAG